MDFLSPKAQKLVPYTAGEQPQDMQYIKLNTNENPYPPSPLAVEALRAFDTDRLRKYPDPNARELVAAIAAARKTSPQNVFVGNGSDEVLAMCFAAFFEGQSVAFADITYSFYTVYADLYAVEKQIIPLVGLHQNTQAYQNCTAKGIVIANPNAPTSVAMSLADIEKIISKNPQKLVIIDEAYVDFGAESAVSLVDKYDNLIVVQTFSKSYSLAGIRCGFAIAQKPLIDGLNRIKNSFNSYTLDFLAQTMAAASIADSKYFADCRAKIIDTRTRTLDALRANGFDVAESSTNFLFIRHSEAEAVYKKLKQQGILVRYFAALPDRLRVTVGTDEEMTAFLNALFAIGNK